MHNKSTDLRIKAEKLLREQDDHPELADQELIYELKVHQVELEIQNDELRHNQVLLEQARKSYSDMFDFAPVGYFVLDQKGVIRHCNLTAASQLGADRTRLLGKPFVIHLPESMHRRFFDHIARLFKEGANQACELELKCGEGDTLWCGVHSRLHPMAEGELLCLMATSDISDRMTMEQELVRARDMAEAASIAKSEFLATMSHEIRTPLNGVLGMLTLLTDTALSPGQQEYVEAGLNSARGLLEVINDILDYSKIEAGELSLEFAPFSLKEMMSSALGTFAHMARGKGIALDVQYDARLPDVLVGDAARIRQVLSNLVSNAVKFTDKGSITITASQGGQPADGASLLLEVKDTGIGIQADFRDKIFQSFTQADGTYARKYSGTGLGLAICKKLAIMMGGKVWYTSVPGQGSSFFLQVPVGYVRERPAPLPSVPADMPPLRAGKLRVLVAEDNAVSAKFIQKIMEKLGFFVTLVEDGTMVLPAMQKSRYDLVLMDVSMPVMDGLEATGLIRASRLPGVDPNIPIIALTAHAMGGDREKCLAAGMDDYASKPLSVQQIMDIIRRHLPEDATDPRRTGDA